MAIFAEIGVLDAQTQAPRRFDLREVNPVQFRDSVKKTAGLVLTADFAVELGAPQKGKTQAAVERGDLVAGVFAAGEVVPAQNGDEFGQIDGGALWEAHFEGKVRGRGAEGGYPLVGSDFVKHIILLGLRFWQISQAFENKVLVGKHIVFKWMGRIREGVAPIRLILKAHVAMYIIPLGLGTSAIFRRKGEWSAPRSGRFAIIAFNCRTESFYPSTSRITG